jgi:hypothetical protein
MTTVTTAKSGKALREYASTKRGDKNVAVFPECGLSASEQASFMISNAHKYTEIITFSNYIISDTKDSKLNIIDDQSHQCPINHGDSVNRISLILGRRETVGDVVVCRLILLRKYLDIANSKESIQEVIDLVYSEIGDCIEKVLFVKSAMDKQKRLNK